MLCLTVVISIVLIWLSRNFKPLLQLHQDIEGRWLVYLWNLIVLRRFRRKNPKGRLDLHDIWNIDDVAKVGMDTLPEEVVYANPKKVRFHIL